MAERRVVVVWDIDNCLADDEWRIRHIDWHATDPDARYAQYHTLARNDRAANMDVFEASLRRHAAAAVFVTARPFAFYLDTAAWLVRWVTRAPLGVGQLMMRANGDHRPTVAVKRDAVRALLCDAHVAEAHDDHAGVVAMYRDELGITAHRTFAHSTCAYTPPTAGAQR